MYRYAPIVTAALFGIALSALPARAHEPVDSLAREYVRLVLRVGRYVPDYVDAYFGPAELKEAAAQEEVEKGFPYQRLCLDAEQLLSEMRGAADSGWSETDRRRAVFMLSQLASLRGVLDSHRGHTLPFAQEVMAIYGVRTTERDSASYENQRKVLDSLIPGTGDPATRYETFLQQFTVPRHLMDTVVKLCLGEFRRRTAEYIDLPANEALRVELVGGRSWGGYNWYLGDLQSLVQIDTTELPHVGVLMEIVAHEGYPGHHLANVIRESILVKDSGWVEHSVCPLFCPQSVLDEGMATVALDVVLPIEERIAFCQTIIFPLLNLDTALAGPYWRIADERTKLGSIDLDVARGFLEGTLDSTRALALLARYRLSSTDRAKQSLEFIRDFRSYIVTYTVGENLVREHLRMNGGTSENPGKRWGLFHRLIASSMLPSDLE